VVDCEYDTSKEKEQEEKQNQTEESFRKKGGA
jgi:hypothetical protein